jgi:hypothetical protein
MTKEADEASVLSVNWREAQAEHHDRMARLAIAYAAAFEGDLTYAGSNRQSQYLQKRATAYRLEAGRRSAKASELRKRHASDVA